ncbi:hypothetical protein UFOVP1309_29 [uncultured Caudovirales phage]|uniref:Phage neck terminator protein gp12-like domain-containing protein n=1 Tax=uncultured Caudovirales phage TaxID=2100421 RepID=A0A6J5RZB2_9CAUD|nr:hypothetical protein UFOVP1309_29 [uncultured Caudovirales phage]
MNVATLKSRLYALIDPFFTEPVIWADQTSPRPPLPYVTIRMGVITPIGESHYSDVDSLGVQTVTGVRESILNVNRFGPESVSSLETFADKLTLNTTLDKFSIQKIAAFDVSPVTDIAQLLNGIAIEPRASVDVSIRWNADQTDNVGIIQTVTSGGTVGPSGTKLNEEYVLTINTVAY